MTEVKVESAPKPKKTATASKAAVEAKAGVEAKASVKKAPAAKAAAPKAAKSDAPKTTAAKKPSTRTTKAKSAGVSPEQRYLMICEAAYYKAERRGFSPENEVEDWLEAEAEINRLLNP